MKDTLTVAKHDLKSFADIQYGFTAKANPDPIGPKFLRITDIQDGRVDWDLVPFCKATEAEIAKFRLSPGEIVFARTGATTGKSFLIKDEVEAVFASYLIRVKPVGGRALPDYLAYYFQTPDYWDHVTAGTEGAAQGGFNASKLGRLEIPLPPLEEQKQIVAVLDQAFAALDRARAHAEANLADAEELFAQARSATLWPDDVPATWTSEKLGQCLDVQSGFAFRSADYTDEGHFLIRIANVQDGELSLHRPKYVVLDAKTRRFALNEGDVLTSLTGNIGRVAEVHAEHLPAALNQRVARLLIKNRKDLSRDFLMHFLRSELFGEPLRKKSRGAAQQNVSPREIANVAVLLPPLADQEDIAAKLETIWNRVEVLRNSYEVTLSEIADLRRSLLQKAFSGQLTA